jgi:hypothetical protein
LTEYIASVELLAAGLHSVHLIQISQDSRDFKVSPQSPTEAVYKLKEANTLGRRSSALAVGIGRKVRKEIKKRGLPMQVF